MLKKRTRIHIGLRTAKTAAAVVISMLIVDSYGATTSKLVFAMLGAMAAVQPTFMESLESSLAQVVGVIFGAITGVILMGLRLPPLLCAGIGIIMVITLYNALGIRYAPALPCLIVVTICTASEMQPILYALGRIWDTAIGMAVGMLINSLIYPYDNSNQIRGTVESLDKVVIRFLEEMFDGDDILPDAKETARYIDTMARQLRTFSNQKLLMQLKRQQQELESFQKCEGKARDLLAQMEVLCHMGRPGRLSEENRRRLESCGADIRDERVLDSVLERDVVTNYHVAQILNLRRELMETLNR